MNLGNINQPYSNRPSTSVSYGYTTAENVDAANYSINKQPLSVSSQDSQHSSIDDFTDLI